MIQYKVPGVTVFESALYRTTSAVIEVGGIILVVDPNWLPEEVNRIRNYVNAVRNCRPVYLLFTHSDYDHILGWLAFPGAVVIASSAFADNPEKENALEQIRQFDEEYYIHRDYEIAYPVVDIKIMEDEQVVELEKARLHFYQAPGHTGDGLFAFVENTATWIAGDYLSNIEFPFIYDSSYAYEKTLQKALGIIRENEPNLLIPGHGDVTSDRADMLGRYNEAMEYLYDVRRSIQSGTPFPEDVLWKRYGNKRGLAASHLENLEFIKKELETKS